MKIDIENFRRDSFYFTDYSPDEGKNKTFEVVVERNQKSGRVIIHINAGETPQEGDFQRYQDTLKALSPKDIKITSPITSVGRQSSGSSLKALDPLSEIPFEKIKIMKMPDASALFYKKFLEIVNASTSVKELCFDYDENVMQSQKEAVNNLLADLVLKLKKLAINRIIGTEKFKKNIRTTKTLEKLHICGADCNDILKAFSEDIYRNESITELMLEGLRTNDPEEQKEMVAKISSMLGMEKNKRVNRKLKKILSSKPFNYFECGFNESLLTEVDYLKETLKECEKLRHNKLFSYLQGNDFLTTLFNLPPENDKEAEEKITNGKEAFEAKRYDDAIHLLLPGIKYYERKKEKAHASVYYMLALAYKKENQDEDAKKYCEEALKLDKDNKQYQTLDKELTEKLPQHLPENEENKKTMK